MGDEYYGRCSVCHEPFSEEEWDHRHSDEDGLDCHARCCSHCNEEEEEPTILWRDQDLTETSMCPEPIVVPYGDYVGLIVENDRLMQRVNKLSSALAALVGNEPQAEVGS